jgi:hypothetical protein
MINKLILVLNKLALLLLLLLGILSVIVGIFCIDARIHPHEKGISKIDLLDYMHLSFILAFLYLTLKAISVILSKGKEVKNPN